MDNKEKILKAEELLKVNKQENVLNFFKKLSEDKQIKLAEKIDLKINPDYLRNVQLNNVINSMLKQKQNQKYLKKRLHTLNMLMNISCLMKLKKNIQSLEKM